MPNSINMGSLSFPLHLFLEPTLFIIALFYILGYLSLIIN